MAGGSSPNCTLGKSARCSPSSPLHLGPGGLLGPSAPPRPARPSAPQVSVSRVRWGPGRARREGAAGRAQFAAGSLEAENFTGAPPDGPRSLDEIFSLSDPLVFSSVSGDNDRT